MRRLYSPPAKLAGLLLALLFLAACISSGILTVYMMDQGYYDSDTGSYYDTSSFYRVTDLYARQAASMWRRVAEGGEPVWDQYLDPAAYNFGYVVGQADSEAEELSNLSDNYAYREAGTRWHDDVLVRCYVRDPMAARDSYYSPYQIFVQLFPHRYTVVAVLAGSGVAFLAALVYLMAVAGKKYGVEQIVPNWQDRIPLDLYLAAVAAVLAFLYVVASDILFYRSSSIEIWELLLGAALLFAACLPGLALLLTLATRIKLGKPWRSMLLYRLVHAVCTLVALLVRSLPLIWEVMLGFVVVSLLELLVLYQAFTGWYVDALMMVLYLILHLVLFGVVGLTALGLQTLKTAGQRLAEGDLDYKADTRWLFLDLKQHADNLGRIGEGMSTAVAQRTRSERMKTELITNVSHDIKTPLTSIINYVDLLGKQELGPESREYVEVLERQAARLKRLTDDLVEASKASTGNLTVVPEHIDLCELVNQTLGEYDERMAERSLEPILTLPDEAVPVLADGKHLWRVMDNLLSNICKYSQPHTRVYIDVSRTAQEAAIVLKNISGARLNLDAAELMERFVRADASRASEGSGLGLHIARSLVELQGGRLMLTVDGDLFKAELFLPLCQHDTLPGQAPDAPQTQLEPLEQEAPAE